LSAAFCAALAGVLMTGSRRRIETLAVQGFEKLNLNFCAPNVRLTGLLVIQKRLQKSFGLLM